MVTADDAKDMGDVLTEFFVTGALPGAAPS